MSNKTDKNTSNFFRDLKVEYRPTGSLKPYPRNARTHTKKQIQQIAESIEKFGWTNPVLIDGEGGIIAGHGRVEAAKILGLSDVPTILLDHLTPDQKRAYTLADNRLAELAGWDKDILAIEFQHFVEVDFDVEITGFEMPEIDLLIQDLVPDDDPDDEIPEIGDNASSVSQSGDLWVLGEHRLFCGDARDVAAYKKLMGDDLARVIFTDPPYNVEIDGHVCGLGSIKHADFQVASGEMSPVEFTQFLTAPLSHMAQFSVDGSLHYVCMDWRHIEELLTAGKSVYAELKNLCVWNKDNGGMGSFYRSKHELVFVFKNGTSPHVNNVELGRHGRNRTNVWDYPGINTLRNGRMEELAMHPTVKPVAMVADAIMDCSHRGEIVLDCFSGSGTTIIAAEKVGRRAFAMELDPLYVDVAIRRWQKFTAGTALHADTGVTFDDMADCRHAETPLLSPTAAHQPAKEV